VREKVDADYAEAKQNAKELKPIVRDLTGDTTSENDTPAKTTHAKKRTRLNQQQRMASKISDLSLSAVKSVAVGDTIKYHSDGPRGRSGAQSVRVYPLFKALCGPCRGREPHTCSAKVGHLRI
jgi:hypothetical protein